MAQDRRERPKSEGGCRREKMTDVHRLGQVAHHTTPHHSNNATPITTPATQTPPIHATLSNSLIALLTKTPPSPPTVKFTLNVCVGNIFGVELIKYKGLIGAPSNWYICNFGPRAASCEMVQDCMSTVVLNWVMTLDFAAQGSCT